MIIVCAGDSFTHGMELWEEKNVPGYTAIKTQKEAFAVKETSLDFEEERLKLAWPEVLRKEFDCEVINLGEDGSSEHSIMSRTMQTLMQLRKSCPTEKIICIMQDTEVERIWFWYEEFEKNLSIPIVCIFDYYPGRKLDAYEIKDIYLTKQPGELLLSEYYLQGLSVRNYCTHNNIDFLHFQMFRKWKRSDYKFNNFEFSKIEKAYFDLKYTIDGTMTERLVEHYKHNNFNLPGQHFNCEAQQVIGKIVIEELQDRGIV